MKYLANPLKYAPPPGCGNLSPNERRAKNCNCNGIFGSVHIDLEHTFLAAILMLNGLGPTEEMAGSFTSCPGRTLGIKEK